MNDRWTDERNRMVVNSVKSELQLLVNFGNKLCFEVYNNQFKTNAKLLENVRAAEKYCYSRVAEDQ